MTSTDDAKPLLPLVPVAQVVDKQRISTYRVYSIPGDTDSTRYDFTMNQLDGTEGLRAILDFRRNCDKLRVASDNEDAARAPAFHSIVENMLHAAAKTAYTLGVNAHVAVSWRNAKEAYIATWITIGTNVTDVAAVTAAEMVRAKRAADTPESPSFFATRIEVLCPRLKPFNRYNTSITSTFRIPNPSTYHD